MFTTGECSGSYNVWMINKVLIAYMQERSASGFPIVRFELLDAPVLPEAYKYLTKPSLLTKTHKKELTWSFEKPVD